MAALTGDAFAERLSQANQEYQEKGVHYKGRILLRLAHSAGRSVVIPSQLFLPHGNRWDYYQTSFFAPNQFANFGDFKHGRISIDVVHPQGKYPTRLTIEFKSGDLIRIFSGELQLYNCEFWGPRNIRSFASGIGEMDDDDTPWIKLNHFTTGPNRKSILNDGNFRSSQWNLRGSRRFENVRFVYFTSLPRIKSETDLKRIAMSSDGQIPFQTTPIIGEPEVILLEVYRESTVNRTQKISLWLPCWSLTASPVLFHRPARDPNYYEIVTPEIFRVGLIPESYLQFENGRAHVEPRELYKFEYIVMGDALTAEGVQAPYDEENTAQRFMFEQLPNDLDILDFWFANSNTDLFSHIGFEPLEFVDD